jgi:hypothetical protein
VRLEPPSCCTVPGGALAMGWLNGVFAFDGACGLDILGDAVDGLDGCKNKYNTSRTHCTETARRLVL